jgi:hypothetical protein
MGYRHPNPRRIKLHRNYSVEEVATLFRIHKNTVRHWLKQGLQPIDDQRPTLIRGPELVRFITERRKRLKQKCRLEESGTLSVNCDSISKAATDENAQRPE